MFQKIESGQLIYNKQYKIGDLYKGTYKGRVFIHEYYLEFDTIRQFDGTPIHRNLYFLPHNSYYEFVSQKKRIQWEMEYRSVNLFLRKLIGDDTFRW
jgi:hypothetical protein